MRTFKPARIVALRTALGLSRAEFARKVGVVRSTVWTWEAAHRVPEHASLMKLAELTGGRLDSFFANGSDGQSVKRKRLS